MNENILNVRIVNRSDTEENWNKYNPILQIGEIGYDVTNNKIKIGDGASTWDALPFFEEKIDGGVY